MNKAVSVSIFMAFLASVLTAQQQIPTGGRIPDRRGFNNSVDNPKLTDPVEEVVRRVAGNVYVIAGAGGNIVVQTGSDGLLLVDDNFTVFYPKIMAAIRQISDKPVRIIINTHWHPDHNQNNANFAKQGSLVFAHPNTRAALANPGVLSTWSTGVVVQGNGKSVPIMITGCVAHCSASCASQKFNLASGSLLYRANIHGGVELAEPDSSAGKHDNI